MLWSHDVTPCGFLLTPKCYASLNMSSPFFMPVNLLINVKDTSVLLNMVIALCSTYYCLTHDTRIQWLKTGILFCPYFYGSGILEKLRGAVHIWFRRHQLGWQGLKGPFPRWLLHSSVRYVVFLGHLFSPYDVSFSRATSYGLGFSQLGGLG